MQTKLIQQNIPSGWKEKGLGGFLSISKGKLPKKTYEIADENSVPYLSIKHLDGNEFKYAHKSDGVIADKNDLLVVADGSGSGRMYRGHHGLVSSTFLKISSKSQNELLNDYLEVLFSHLDFTKSRFRKGGAIPHFDFKQLKDVDILLPPIKEQQKIAEILRTVDEDIAKTQEVIGATEKLKRGLSRQLFTRGVNDRIEELMLGNISTVTSSKRIMRSEYVESGIPFYRSKEVIEKAKGIKHDSVFYISKERYKEIEQKFGAPHIGDILMTAVGTIGVIYLVDEKEFYFKDGNLLWIKDINKSLNKSYLKYYMNSEIFQKRVLGTAIGSNQKALTIEKVEKVIVPIPKLQEQQKIVDILSAVDEKISVNKKLKTKLTLLKKGLMQDLLSGKVRTNI